MILWMWAASTAWAGDGPWTLNPGETNLYAGVDVYQYENFHDGTKVRSLGTGLSAASVTAVVTHGLVRDVEVELRLPYERVRANNPTADACQVKAAPSDWCTHTDGLGDVVMIAKYRLLDEYKLRPLSASVGFVFRTGEAYSERRGRLTTLGDGQSDVGLTVAAGRGGNVGQGWYQGSINAAYMYRMPHSFGDEPGNNGQKIPADEVSSDVSASYSPTGRFSFGPAVSFFSKTGGTQLNQAKLYTLNGFASLAGTQLKVGGRFSLYGGEGLTLSLGAYRAVFARNNPVDTTSVSIGVGWFRKPKDKAEG